MGGDRMRIGDFYGKVEFLDVLFETKIRHDAKWVVRRAFALSPSGNLSAHAILPDAFTYPMQPGKEVWVTNNGNPGDPPPGGNWRPFLVREILSNGSQSTVATLSYPQTGVFMLGADNRWRLVRRFTSIEFTAVSLGWEETYTIDVTSDRQGINVDDEIRAMGWNGESDVFVELIVRSGVVVSAASTVAYAIRANLTGVDSRLFILVEPNGLITGAGGAGGNGGVGGAFIGSGTNGQKGGAAIRAETRVTINNAGIICGGGGGGGGADGTSVAGGGAGGGGAGFIPGLGGQGFGSPPASAGNVNSGGQGGVPPFTGTLGIGGNGGGRGQGGASPSIGSAVGGFAGEWLVFRTFGLPGGEQPIIFATGAGQQLGGIAQLT